MADLSAKVIQQAQAGDEAALTELVQSQQNYIYSIAMGVFRNPEDAADMTQEAFIHLFRVLPSYRGETRFTTWLYRVVVNLCYDELRRRKRRPQPASEEAMAVMPETASWSDPEKEMTRAETQLRVRSALMQLEDPYRLVLTLYYFEGLKYREIAEVTGIPLNTIKSHIYRGKARLAELLTESADMGEDTPSPPLAALKGRSEKEPASQTRLALVAARTR
jgi:RNA polymerase sigma-70 factor (ECF subfamily)